MKPALLLIVAGLALVVTGLVLLAAPRFPLLSWIGHLPGDLRVERPNFRFYFPLATCLVLSLVLTLVVRLVRFLLER